MLLECFLAGFVMFLTLLFILVTLKNSIRNQW